MAMKNTVVIPVSGITNEQRFFIKDFLGILPWVKKVRIVN